MRMYRVECNFGSKYFETATKGFAYFKKKKAKHLDVEIWLVNYSYSQKTNTYSATQELLDYSSTNLPKQ